MMRRETSLRFAGFRLEPDNARLWRGAHALKLKPKAFAVLHYLVEHAGQLVTKDALWQAVWPDVTVSDDVLTACVRDIRKALSDDPKTPRLIETVHRRGYRFIAPLTTAPPVSSSPFPVSSLAPTPSSQQPTPDLVVGRETELAQLHRWLDEALKGKRQVVFVTGEAGIGKTALVDRFVAYVAAAPQIRLGRGQCIEHYGAGEAYLPVLEAFGRLCREPEGTHVIELLHQYAPTWLVQMPALLSAADFEVLQRKVGGATKERMLREMVEALEALTAERGLIVVLEDLPWSDYSTLEWLAAVARRREPAKLLVIGTYRLVEVIVSEHPLRSLKQELQIHGHCEELPLRYLTQEAVEEYLAARFAVGAHTGSALRSPHTAAGWAPFQRLAKLIHQRTEGNPLFMVNVVEYLVTQGVLVPVEGRWELKGRLEDLVVGMPQSLRQMIEKQLVELGAEERQMLEVASMAGMEFSAAAVAAGSEKGEEEIEGRCEALARRGRFLEACGTVEWPDGTVAARYGFLHALYQEVLYERVPAGRRARLHQRIGERLEAAYGEQARAVSAELAVHFEQGRNYRRAVQYLQQAGENARRRSAYQEALSLFTKGLELLQTLPDTSERAQQEMTLQLALSVPLMATRGYAAPTVEQACTRALELCRQVGDTPQLFPVLVGLRLFYLLRAELQTARELGEQLLRLAQSVQDPALLLEAHYALGVPLFWLGEFALAWEHFEQGIALYNPQQHRSHAFLYGQDPGVGCLSYASGALWHLGYSDQALKRSHEALTLAHELSHPLSLAFALSFAGTFHLLRREAQATRERAEAMMTLSREQGFPYFLAGGAYLRGWALIQQGQVEEGIAQMREGMAAVRATGAQINRPGHLAQLAWAYGTMGQADEGLTLLAEALTEVHRKGQRYYEAELYRLKGELTLQKFQVSGFRFQVPPSP